MYRINPKNPKVVWVSETNKDLIITYIENFLVITGKGLSSRQISYGLPLSVLRLKIGAPVMLLRNLDPLHGLCNGTRMTVLRASTRCLEVRLNGGSFDGEKRLIYRTKLTSNETDFHFQLTRFQFPVRLAFAMTINKSQGQSLTHVGIDLRSPVFSHGQLYVAFSRATDVPEIATLIKESNVDEVTDNIVYPEVLQGLLQWFSFSFPLSLSYFLSVLLLFVNLVIRCRGWESFALLFGFHVFLAV